MAQSSDYHALNSNSVEMHSTGQLVHLEVPDSDSDLDPANCIDHYFKARVNFAITST
jgi:hypothetical protein